MFQRKRYHKPQAVEGTTFQSRRKYN
jgi:hypothetical protein